MKLKNYRYNNHCPECGKFKGENHKCKIKFKRRSWWTGRYKCGRCHRYLPQEQFQKDCTKRFGINTRCKKCRKETGNGNAKWKRVKKYEHRRKPRRRIKR